MGEKPAEEKKMEQEAGKKPEEEKKPEKPPEKSENPPEKDPKDENPKKEEKKPPEIVLKVYMHCEGCARKVRRCLKGFEGVEDVMTDCKTGKVVVKGEKADPLKVLERVQKKSHRQVELLSPVPAPAPEPKPAGGEPEKKSDEKEKPKAEEKKEEVVTVVLRVHMHCEACAMEIQKRILRMKGVESAEPDFKASQVTVKGAFTPAKLVEYVYSRTSKHATVVKQDPPPPKADKKDKDKEPAAAAATGADAAAAADKKGKDDKKPEEDPKSETKGGGGGGDAAAKEAKDGGEAGAVASAAVIEGTSKAVELMRSEYTYQPRYPPMEMYHAYGYPPQLFSDENPNACTVM